jgi:phospholipid/cholesterol/gamma-HCH transport system ATP-binding protein
MNILEAKNLVLGYGETVVLEEMTFAIPKGKITAIIGESGSGKTTLFKTLIGLIPPLRGEITFLGKRVDFRSEKSLAALYEEIGVLYQGGALLNSMTLYENIALPLRMRYLGLDKEIEAALVNSKLALVGLQGSGGKYPSELSGGMKKRAALARAMILDPQVIFCDEPSSGLDPITSSSLDELLLGLKETAGMTLVVITHELRSIEKIADTVVLLNKAKIHFSGGLEELHDHADAYIRKFFLKKDKP